MASIRKEIAVMAPAAFAWDAVRDYGALHTRLVPGLVTNTVLENDAKIRVVTFSDGLVLREHIIAVDDDIRRLVWSIEGEPFEHHNASVEIIDEGANCRVVWTADMLPHGLAETVATIMDNGLDVTKRTLEAAANAKGEAVSQSGSTQPPSVFCSTRKPTLHHVCLFVSDLEASTKFYTSGLGLVVRKQFDDIVGQRGAGAFPFGVASVFLEAGVGRYIELHPAGGGTMSPPGFPLNHLALSVDDVDAAYERAVSAGGTAIDIPVPNEKWGGTPLDVVMSGDHPESMRMAFIQGPDGELIELYRSTFVC